MVGEFAQRRFGVPGVPRFEDRADAAVQTHAAWPAQRRVQSLPNQRVGERVASWWTGFLLNDPALRSLIERLEQRLAVQL